MAYGIEREFLSWPNDRVDSGVDLTAIRLTLISVAGFTVDRNNDTRTFTIQEDDDCTMPEGNAENGGIVYRPNPQGSLASGLCVCAAKSTVVQAGIAAGEAESYAMTALKWRTDSTNYCPDSPYQRPGG
ncbi:MAG: hypothetical protein OXE97_04400 [Gammaproteobacteria bacterium]|nr:hypothetical protein [Gammaproteobacteria bacterium]